MWIYLFFQWENRQSNVCGGVNHLSNNNCHFLSAVFEPSGYIVLKLICEKVLLWNIVTCWGMCVCYQQHSTHSGFLSSTDCLNHSASIWLWSVRLLNWLSDFICLMRPQTPNYFPCLQRLQRTDNLICYSL